MDIGMVSDKYVSMKYANVKDFAEELSISAEDINKLDEETRSRYQRWLLEGQNNTEAAISDVSPTIDIAENTPEYTFAKNAVVNWALYKKRARDGSPNKDDAKEDYLMNIEYLTKILVQERGTRTRVVSIVGEPFPDQILIPSQLYTEFY